MEHTIEKLSGNKVKIAFKVAAADFEQAIEKAYIKLRGQIAVPGFRKGKAPRKLIEKMYGTGIFYEEALDVVFPDAYMSAVKENDLKPVSAPSLSSIDVMEAGKDLEFSCEVYVMPEVKLGEYKGVEIAKQVRKVTEEAIDARIEQERKRVARSVEVTDRALENGDNAELDYSGSVDGVKFEGGTKDSVTGTTTYTDEEKQKAKDAAQAILDEFLKGEKQDSEAFGELAKTKSQDTGSKSNGGLIENIYRDAGYVETFTDWAIAGHQVGDTGLIETEYGWHVMFYKADGETTYRDQMISNQMINEAYTAWNEACMAAVNSTVHSDKGLDRNLVVSGN